MDQTHRDAFHPLSFPVAVYLDQRIVFDLLAVIEGGLVEVETVLSDRSTSTNTEGDFSGSISAGAALASFFNVKLSGKSARKASQSTGEKVEAKRVHTPASLFSRVRDHLTDIDGVHSDEKVIPTAGSFVEMRVRLEKSPIVALFEAFEGIAEIGKVLSGVEKKEKAQNQNGKRDYSLDDIRKMSKRMLEDLTRGTTIDLVGNRVGDGLEMVVTFDKQNLRDPSLADLTDGEFSIFGKVTRTLPGDSKETLDLLRGSSMGRLNEDALKKMLIGFEAARDSGMLKLPKIRASISAPALQILPIAVFA